MKKEQNKAVVLTEQTVSVLIFAQCNAFSH